MPLVRFSSLEESFARTVQLPKCNTEACTDRFAPCFNRGTKTYYCVRCARGINFAPLPDGTYLCEIPPIDLTLADLEGACYDGAQYVGSVKLTDLIASKTIHRDLLAPNWKEQLEKLEK